MISARAFADSAESFEGVRWRLHGRSRRAGVDCGGLLVASLAELGVTAPDSRDYDARMPSPELLLRLLRDGGSEVGHDDCGEGRVGLCRILKHGEPRHLVVMLSGRRIAHVEARVRRVAVVPASRFAGRLVSVFRINGVEYGDPW